MIVAGARWTFASNLIQSAVSLIQVAILARLLTPADFGVMAIAMVLIGFLSLYADLGISGGIIHHQKISHDDLEVLFTLNLLVGLGIAAAILISAAPLGRYYHQPALQPVLSWLAIGAFATSIGNLFRTLNQKHFRFALMAKIEISASVVGLIAATLLALAGFGVYALIAGTLAASLTSSASNIASGLTLFRPRLSLRLGLARRYLHFGVFQMAETTLNYFNSQLDIAFLGRFVGPGALGQYSLAKNLCTRPSALINPVFTRIALPLMSVHQSDQRRLLSLYLDGMRITTAINFPIYALIAVCADPISLVLFGPQLSDTGGLISLLGIYFLIRSTGNPVGTLLVSTGRVQRGFIWNLALFLIIPSAILFASSGGTVAIAKALVLTQLLLVIPGWYFLVRPCCGADLRGYFGSMVPSLWISVASCIPSLALMHSPLRALPLVLLSGASFIITYVVLTIRFNKSLEDALRRASALRHDEIEMTPNPAAPGHPNEDRQP